ncbi:WD40 repeat domain-containing protein [Wenjunlia vitaminophila]|uniref:WD40 repeat domain-containing protein n=1 Tax=Wenjunlia vitaminophila TaxID=76728 RepID=UPI0003A00F76|nr:WD40 repeat domain-containing protein [Wenjunlia vitaminophila]
MSGSPAAGVLSPNVLKQIERLGGRVPDGFRPRDWSVPTPAGEHRVPPAVQEFLAVEWPSDQGLCTDDEFRWEVHLPSDCEVGRLVVEDTPRAWYAVGWDEGQWFLLVDLAEADTDDFRVYRVDHDGSDDASSWRYLSRLLDDLRMVRDRIVVPDTVLAGEAAATSAGADEVVTDAHSLVNADPLTVMPLLDGVTTERGEQAASVYRASVGRHHNAGAAVRRQLLALDAARLGELGLSRELAEVPVPGAPPLDWTVEWATGAALDRRLRLRLPVAGPQAFAELDGRTVAVTVHAWKLHVHDLATGRSLVEAHLECDQEFASLAVAELDGRWIVVTGSNCPGCDRHDTCRAEFRRWNLADGNPVGAPVRAHPRSVNALAVAAVDGRPVLLSGGYDCVLRMWDLRTDEPIGEPAVGHQRGEEWELGIGGVAVTEIDGRTVAVTGAGDGTVRLWALGEGCVPGQLMTSGDDGDTWITSVAVCRLDGLPVAVTSGDDDVRAWDLCSGRQLGAVVTRGCTRSDVVEIDGRPVVVTATYDGWVRRWDLATREEMGSPVNVFTGDRRVVSAVAAVRVRGRAVAVVPDYRETAVVDLTSGGSDRTGVGHSDAIKALAVADSDGSPVVVTGGDDATARIWDLRDGSPVCPPLSGHSVWVNAVAVTRVGDRPAVLTADGDAVRVWDPATGELSRRIEALRADGGHQVLTLAAGRVGGRDVAVTGGYDGQVLAWGLGDAAAVVRPTPVGPGKYLYSVVELAGRQVAVAGDGAVVRVLDLLSGEELRSLDEGAGVDAATVARSGERVFVAFATYGELVVRDLASGARVGALAGTGSTKALALADVGGRLVAARAGFDRTVQVWDVAEDRPRPTSLTFPEEVNALALTRGGRLVVAFGSDLAVLSPRG